MPLMVSMLNTTLFQSMAICSEGIPSIAIFPPWAMFSIMSRKAAGLPDISSPTSNPSFIPTCSSNCWQAHRWHPIDPLKTIKAQRERIEARLTSLQRVIAETGEDPDEVIAELLEWEVKTAGLPKPAPRAAGPAEPEEPEDDTPAATAARRLQLIASRGMRS